MQVISFFVEGEPAAQPRAKARQQKFGDKTFVRMYTPRGAEGWKELIRVVALQHKPEQPIYSACRVDLEFYFSRSGDHYGKKNGERYLKRKAPVYQFTKPDRDNLDKAVLDVLKNLGFFFDDSRVSAGEITKYYATPPITRMGCQISIRPLENEVGNLPHLAHLFCGDDPKPVDSGTLPLL